MYLGKVASRLVLKGLTVDWAVLSGTPAQELVGYARKTPQDMVVMSTHGRSGVTLRVLGSVTEAVVRASGDPVLIIPPAKA